MPTRLHRRTEDGAEQDQTQQHEQADRDPPPWPQIPVFGWHRLVAHPNATVLSPIESEQLGGARRNDAPHTGARLGRLDKVSSKVETMVQRDSYGKTMESAARKSKHPGGRPRKFSEPSQPVTVTLPDRTLGLLQNIDEDRAKAIVKAVDHAVGRRTKPSRRVEVVEMAPGMGILVVPFNRSLRSIPWLRMIEVAPMRHLLAIVPGTPIEKVEVALLDIIDNARVSAPDEVELLKVLREKIGDMRRGDRISKAEILVITRRDGKA